MQPNGAAAVHEEIGRGEDGGAESERPHAGAIDAPVAQADPEEIERESPEQHREDHGLRARGADQEKAEQRPELSRLRRHPLGGSRRQPWVQQATEDEQGRDEQGHAEQLARAHPEIDHAEAAEGPDLMHDQVDLADEEKEGEGERPRPEPPRDRPTEQRHLEGEQGDQRQQVEPEDHQRQVDPGDLRDRRGVDGAEVVVGEGLAGDAVVVGGPVMEGRRRHGDVEGEVSVVGDAGGRARERRGGEVGQPDVGEGHQAEAGDRPPGPGSEGRQRSPFPGGSRAPPDREHGRDRNHHGIGEECVANPERRRHAEGEDLEGQPDRPAERQLPRASAHTRADGPEDEPAGTDDEHDLIGEVADHVVEPDPTDQPQDQRPDRDRDGRYGEYSVTASITSVCSSSRRPANSGSRTSRPAALSDTGSGGPSGARRPPIAEV
jgi:hypothetical protein